MPHPTSSAAQIGRVVRFYKKFKDIDSGVMHDRPSIEREDDVYSFFLNCYHLKDWIKHDAAFASLGNVEVFINSSPEMQICADLCNALKHFKLTSRRSSADPSMGAKRFNLSINVGEPTVISVRFGIDTRAGEQDAFDIATKCIKAWTTFLGLKVEDFHEA